MDLKNKLIFNYIIDKCKKLDLDMYERAEAIKEYMNAQCIKSQRELSRKLNIPHSTIQDWLRPLELTKEEYKKRADTTPKAKLYRELRGYPCKKQEENTNNIKHHAETPNLDDLIIYFRGFNPDAIEKIKVRDLISVLLDCLKR